MSELPADPHRAVSRWQTRLRAGLICLVAVLVAVLGNCRTQSSYRTRFRKEQRKTQIHDIASGFET
jgi:hypothetical protein